MNIFNMIEKVFRFNSQEEVSGYPTKEEYEKRIMDIQKKELESERFKRIEDFVFSYRQRKNKNLESELFKIVGTYGMDNFLINKDYAIKKSVKINRFNQLIKFIESLTPEEIGSNIYLKFTQIFIKTSVEDCSIIMELLKKKVKNIELLNSNQILEINIDIPERTLELVPLVVSEQTPIPYYRPHAYKYSYVNLLDDKNKMIYSEYNEYVRNVVKILVDIYCLQMWNLLVEYSEQIEISNFLILNNESEHKFMTTYIVRKKKNMYQLSEIEKEKFSMLIGLPFEEIVSVLDKYKQEKLSYLQSENLTIDVFGDTKNVDEGDKESDVINNESRYVLKKVKDDSKDNR